MTHEYRRYWTITLASVALSFGSATLQAQHTSNNTDETTKQETTMKKQTECKSDMSITNADGKDGTDNNGPDSGNGAKGGTIKNPCKAKGDVSANGGNGGNGNSGRKSGNGGAGGRIEF
jgi:hypothetical protein